MAVTGAGHQATTSTCYMYFEAQTMKVPFISDFGQQEPPAWSFKSCRPVQSSMCVSEHRVRACCSDLPDVCTRRLLTYKCSTLVLYGYVYVRREARSVDSGPNLEGGHGIFAVLDACRL